MAGCDSRRFGGRRGAGDISGRTLVGSRSLDLSDRFVLRGGAGRRRRTFRRSTGMGRRFSAPVTGGNVTNSDDEKRLDRRHFLHCMAWVGTGAVWTMSSGVLHGSPLGL